jgi:hypothetical protein
MTGGVLRQDALACSLAKTRSLLLRTIFQDRSSLIFVVRKKDLLSGRQEFVQAIPGVGENRGTAG